MGILQARTLEGLPCPPPGDFLNPGIKPRSPALQADSLSSEPPEKPPPLKCLLYREFQVFVFDKHKLLGVSLKHWVYSGGEPWHSPAKCLGKGWGCQAVGGRGTAAGHSQDLSPLETLLSGRRRKFHVNQFGDPTSPC